MFWLLASATFFKCRVLYVISVPNALRNDGSTETTKAKIPTQTVTIDVKVAIDILENRVAGTINSPRVCLLNLRL